MFERVLNAPLIFYGIAILRMAFVGGPFVFKLLVVCLRYYENSVTGDFQKFSKIFQNRY